MSDSAKTENPQARLRKLIQKWSVPPKKSKVPAKGFDPASQTLLNIKKSGNVYCKKTSQKDRLS